MPLFPFRDEFIGWNETIFEDLKNGIKSYLNPFDFLNITLRVTIIPAAELRNAFYPIFGL